LSDVPDLEERHFLSLIRKEEIPTLRLVHYHLGEVDRKA
jgi:hypothetical protein